MTATGESVTYGKWILAGEHAVLRGGRALAFPLLSRCLKLTFEPADGLDVTFTGPHGEEFKLLFAGVLDSALTRLKRSHPPRGRFVIDSSLPVGTGLGASAALCGSVARWCGAMGWLAEAEHYEFARGLEDLFHGESSGLDVAVSLGARGVRFTRGQPFETVSPNWWPRLYLSYSGQRGITSECVNKVKSLFLTDPGRAAEIDRQMGRAVELVDRALSNQNGFEGFAEGIRLARGCFEEWNLCPPDVARHLDELTAAGAVAVKPTGSGGGGFVLSLWAEEPPADMRTGLIRADRPPAS